MKLPHQVLGFGNGNEKAGHIIPKVSYLVNSRLA